MGQAGAPGPATPWVRLGASKAAFWGCLQEEAAEDKAGDCKALPEALGTSGSFLLPQLPVVSALPPSPNLGPDHDLGPGGTAREEALTCPLQDILSGLDEGQDVGVRLAVPCERDR